MGTGQGGRVWIGDYLKNKRGRTTRVGVNIALPIATGNPYGITTGPDGALWFAERSPSKIGRFVLSTANTHDFNGDFMSDILWRDTSGNTAPWLMNGGPLLQSGSYGAAATHRAIAGQAP